MTSSKQSESVTDDEKKNFKGLLSSFLTDLEKVKNSRFRTRMRLVCEIVMENSDLIAKPKGPLVIMSAFSKYIYFIGEWIELVINLFNLKNEDKRTRKNKNKWITEEKNLLVRSNMFFIYNQLEDFLSKVSNTKGKAAFLNCKDELDPFIELLKRKCIGPSYHFPDGFPLASFDNEFENDFTQDNDSFPFFNKKRKLDEENFNIGNSNEPPISYLDSQESNENVKQFEKGFTPDSGDVNRKEKSKSPEANANDLYSPSSVENSPIATSLLKPQKMQNHGEITSKGIYSDIEKIRCWNTKEKSSSRVQNYFKLPPQIKSTSASYTTNYKKTTAMNNGPSASSTPKIYEKTAKRQEVKKTEVPHLSTINEENSNYNHHLISLRPGSINHNKDLGKCSIKSPQSTASSPTLYYDSQAIRSKSNTFYDDDEDSVYTDFDSDDMEPPMPKFKKFNFKKKSTF